MDFERKNWFHLALNFRESVIRDVKIQVFLNMVVALIITIIYKHGYLGFSQPILAGLIPGIVLGLILVFRTNTAYERFWEGWQIAGMTIFTGRNLSRQMWLTIPDKTLKAREEKAACLRLNAAFFMAMKQHLRHKGVDEQLKSILSLEQYLKLQYVSNMPLQVTQWIGGYLTKQYSEQQIDSIQFAALNRLLDQLVECLSRCERILAAPMPHAYSIHLRHLLILYCFALPFQMVKDLQWWTIPVAGVVAFALFGIEAIGLEIENPFGCDANDIPLDKLCHKLHKDIEEIIAYKTDLDIRGS
ncbi:MAG: bestrophin family protein [Nostoc sp. ChiQUE02]|uniref:bestrophin family protein n=1 Tax=Nostoc sp. ChiQUE02 TaxID=3075377 RepID=UPI002AD4B7A7|nr:bestrophin family ion channel [Nostoc sp. ChiQUE02]MDZ8233776.1 bestrophin family ion channel [Nostoc sp. ChiQUE02]